MKAAGVLMQIAMLHSGEAARQPGGTGSGGEARMLRPTKVRAMLAMRACRGSIMIGTALNHGQMRRIVQRLADLEAPWNCPHGRPTMRHVCVLPKRGAPRPQ